MQKIICLFGTVLFRDGGNGTPTNRMACTWFLMLLGIFFSMQGKLHPWRFLLPEFVCLGTVIQ
jgi:4-amino-4-deoxy-L-arabinose transferase-like glycosyltransferase